MKKVILIFIIFLSLLSSSVQALDVNAASGSVEDIQAAVDEVVAAGGGNVFIPAGTFNFDPRDGITTSSMGNRYVGVKVDVPVGGLNITGAGKDQTILKMPDDMDNDPIFQGSEKWATAGFWIRGHSGGKVRFSGITIKAQTDFINSYVPNVGVWLETCTDFRVDHSSFYWMGEVGVWVSDAESTYGKDPDDAINYVSQGVIDHCDFIDIYKYQVHKAKKGYGYGVSVNRAYNYKWIATTPEGSLTFPNDPWTMFGKYYKNTYIEDCYFTGCRHSLQTTWGGAYVVRNSILEDIMIFESQTTGHPVRLNVTGMLTQEIYNCTIRNTGKWHYCPDPLNGYMPCLDPAEPVRQHIGPHVEGGSALLYNNTVENLYLAFSLSNCEFYTYGGWTNPFYPLGNTKEVYIWGNNIIDCTVPLQSTPGPEGCPAPVEDQEFFTDALGHHTTAEIQALVDAKGYDPYPYPHPLTLGEAPSPEQVSISGKLVNKLNQPLEANIILYNPGTTQLNTSDITSNGNYDLSVWPNTYDLQYNILNFFIENFFIKLSSLDISSSLSNIINYITNISNQNVSFIADITDTQVIQTYSPQKPERILINGTSIPSVSSYSQLTDNTWFYDSTEKKIHMLISPSTIPVCGNAICESGEDNTNCPVDCPLTCSDGTVYGECSSTKPLYCDNGNLINKCSLCGCPSGQSCNITTETCYATGYIFEDGFEGSDEDWNTYTSTGEIVDLNCNSYPHQGNEHLNATSNDEAAVDYAYAYTTFTGQDEVYVRGYFNFTKVPSDFPSGYRDLGSIILVAETDDELMLQFALIVEGTTEYWKINYRDGALWPNNFVETNYESSTSYCFEVYWKKDGSNGQVMSWVDGVLIHNVTGIDSDNYGNVDTVRVGITYGSADMTESYSVFADDIVIDDEYIEC